MANNNYSNFRRYLNISLLILLFILLFFRISEGEKISKEIIKKAFDNYSLSKKKYNQDLHDLVIKLNLDLQDISLIMLELNIEDIKLRSFRFNYLLENDFSRIELEKGIKALTNFQWTDLDEKTLQNINEPYKKTNGLITELTQTIKNHHKLEKYTEFVISLNMNSNEEYNKIFNQLSQTVMQIDKTLNGDNFYLTKMLKDINKENNDMVYINRDKEFKESIIGTWIYEKLNKYSLKDYGETTYFKNGEFIVKGFYRTPNSENNVEISGKWYIKNNYINHSILKSNQPDTPEGMVISEKIIDITIEERKYINECNMEVTEYKK